MRNSKQYLAVAILAITLIIGQNIGFSETFSNLTVTGATALNGNTTLGDASSDNVTFTGRVSSNVIPSVTNTYTLGDSTNYWSSINTEGLNAKGYVSLCDNTSDFITINGTVFSDLLPFPSCSLGRTTCRWLSVNSVDLNTCGNTILGDAAGDTIALNGRVSTDVIPATDDARSLGDISHLWLCGYFDKLRLGVNSNAAAAGTLSASTSNVDNLYQASKTLKSYPLAGSTLNANGDFLRITSYGQADFIGGGVSEIKYRIGVAPYWTDLIVIQNMDSYGIWDLNFLHTIKVICKGDNTFEVVGHVNEADLAGVDHFVGINDPSTPLTLPNGYQWSNDLTIECYVTSTNTGTIIHKGMLVDLHPAAP